MAEHGDEIEPKAKSFMDKVSEKIHRDDSSSSSSSDNESVKKKKQPLHKDAPVTYLVFWSPCHEGRLVVIVAKDGFDARTETGEALNVFLDFDAKNDKGIGVRAELDANYNALFLRAHVQPTSDASFNKFYSSGINLGNDIMYKSIHTENKDGGILLTLHKNPDNVEPIKIIN
ncbi:hypothetical protein Tco_0622726 [Tanacetum coccineum]